MFVAFILFLVVVGTLVFHFWSPYWLTPVASNWGSMDQTLILTFWVTGAVFMAVGLFMVYCVWRYRYQKDRKAEYKPEDKKLEFRLTLLTAIGVVALLAPGLIVWKDFVTVPKNAVEVEVVGYQWGWNYRLPGEDGILGKTDIKNISDKNPYGLDLNDPNSKDDIMVQDADLHLQIDKPVKLLLRSIDVLHNFYVPEFRAKMDMVPGMITFYWLTPTKIGEYEILCAELCGTGHYVMLGTVLVDEEKDYSNWLVQQITFENVLAQNRTIQLAENKK
jgi:cytochrome c oxidase subunit 2|tara:strand:- start:546 stop:1373 length:828 start_codon:yes stop_codon:yes gene_type:complete